MVSGANGPGWNHPFIGDGLHRNDVPWYCNASLPNINCLLHHDGAGTNSLYLFDPEAGFFVPTNGGLGLIHGDWNTAKPSIYPGLQEDLETGVVLRLPDGTRKTFDIITGVLTSITDPRGRGLVMDW